MKGRGCTSEIEKKVVGSGDSDERRVRQHFELLYSNKMHNMERTAMLMHFIAKK